MSLINFKYGTVSVLQTSETHERVILLLTLEGQSFFAIIKRHSGDRHLCGYIAVSREKWNKMEDGFDLANDITYQGIGSTAVSIPPTIRQMMSFVPESEFWIGIDYMGRGDPTPEEIANRLLKICHLFIEASK